MKRLIHVCLLLSIIMLTACSKEESQPLLTKKLKPVRTITVTLGAQSVKSFPGVVDATQSAEIGFRVSGVLKKVNVKEGEHVNKGQVIAELDQTDFKISLNATQSEFDRTSADFNRATKLIKKGAISQSDFEKLKAQKNTAKSHLDSAKQNLKYTVLKSPFDGVLAKVYLSNFEKVSSSEKFAAIQDMSAFEVSIDIPESIMIKLKRHENNHEVYATFDGIHERKYPLTFKEISTRADEQTQTYAIKFIMQPPASINVLPGMSTTVFAIEKNDEVNHDVYVPSHSVLEDSAGRFVYVAKQTNNKMEAIIERRSIVVGQLNENGIQVVQGLNVNDKVITAGMSKVSQGLKVGLLDEAQ
ncbi:MAG: RND family efflux transporter MFP subunit [Oleiphilaceae bacterium]|jgi:RND family efflux transporter MFP subunit